MAQHRWTLISAAATDSEDHFEISATRGFAEHPKSGESRSGGSDRVYLKESTSLKSTTAASDASLSRRGEWEFGGPGPTGMNSAGSRQSAVQFIRVLCPSRNQAATVGSAVLTN